MRMSSAKYFTIIDMKWGYWQVPLNEESSYHTTFNTLYGRFRFTRMSFGLNVAGDAFQCKLDDVYSNLKGGTGIADDMFYIWYFRWWPWPEFNKLLNRTRGHGLKIGSDKIQYKKISFEFYGWQFTTQGHKPMNKKIRTSSWCQNQKTLNSYNHS